MPGGLAGYAAAVLAKQQQKQQQQRQRAAPPPAQAIVVVAAAAERKGKGDDEEEDAGAETTERGRRRRPPLRWSTTGRRWWRSSAGRGRRWMPWCTPRPRSPPGGALAVALPPHLRPAAVAALGREALRAKAEDRRQRRDAKRRRELTRLGLQPPGAPLVAQGGGYEYEYEYEEEEEEEGTYGAAGSGRAGQRRGKKAAAAAAALPTGQQPSRTQPDYTYLRRGTEQRAVEVKPMVLAGAVAGPFLFFPSFAITTRRPLLLGGCWVHSALSFCLLAFLSRKVTGLWKFATLAPTAW